MNFKKTLGIILFLVFNSVFAQQIRIQSFNVPNSLWNPTTKTLSVNRSNASTFLTPIIMGRPTATEWLGKAIDAEVEFTVHKNNSTSTINQTIKFVTSDFIGNTGISLMRSHTINIPHGFIGEAGGYLTVKWRYNKQDYPWPDNNGNGWTNWYTLDFEVNFKLTSIERPPTTFNGPSTICDEGSYTLTDPGTITLENASGIATLTKVNDNTYKVTRVGNAYGNVLLQSVVESKTYKKEITIGAKLDAVLTGPSGIRPGLTYEYKLDFNDDITNYTNIKIEQPTGTTIIEESPTRIKVKVMPNFPFSPGTNEHHIVVTATAQSKSCGSVSISIPVIIFDPRIPVGSN